MSKVTFRFKRIEEFDEVLEDRNRSEVLSAMTNLYIDNEHFKKYIDLKMEDDDYTLEDYVREYLGSDLKVDNQEIENLIDKIWGGYLNSNPDLMIDGLLEMADVLERDLEEGELDEYIKTLPERTREQLE